MINVDFIDSSEVTTERVYQWDIGRKLKISNTGSPIAPVVHFCNKKSEKALAVESIISDEFYIANIPNSLLREEYDIIAYIYVGNEEEAKTIKVVHIPVSKRLKPETYITTEDENVVDFLAVSAEMKSLLDGLVITEYDSTKTYIKPNIVYYKGSSYICKSETSISNVLPTDTTKWGLMCESGANISQITCSNDTLYFKLQNNDILDVPLNSVEISVVETNPVALNITKDENGVLRIGDVVIPQKKLLKTLYTYALDMFADGKPLFTIYNPSTEENEIDIGEFLEHNTKLEIVWGLANYDGGMPYVSESHSIVNYEWLDDMELSITPAIFYDESGVLSGRAGVSRGLIAPIIYVADTGRRGQDVVGNTKLGLKNEFYCSTTSDNLLQPFHHLELNIEIYQIIE